MRLTTHLDNFAKRHKILAAIAAILIIGACLQWAHQADQDNDASLRWQMAANRSVT